MNRERVAIEQDPEVQKAIDAMPKAKALVDNAKKLLVQRHRRSGIARAVTRH